VAARVAGEAGYSLIELLIASLTALLVLGALVALFVITQKDSTGVISRDESIQTADAGLREVGQMLRQAYEVEFPTNTFTTEQSGETACTETAGVQPCNQVDVLVRLSGTDYEIGVNCAKPSTTVVGDQACWMYRCPASATTTSGTVCTSTTATSSNLLIDDLTNGTATNQVFSFCYPNTTGVSTSPCAAGSTRPTSATVTIDTPVTGTLSAAAGGDQSSMVVLTDDVYMGNLDFNQ
jgi:hypothetical protein